MNTTRRDFIASSALGVLALATGCRSASWSGRGPRSPLRIAFFTDVHARREWHTPDALALAAAAIDAERADLVLCGGDLIADGWLLPSHVAAPRWAVYGEMHRAIRGPIRYAVGEQDLVGAFPPDGTSPVADPRAEFRLFTGASRTWYSFDAGGVHVVVLDSVRLATDARNCNGHVSDEQLGWLRGDLSRIDAFTPVVLMLHIPLIAASGAEAGVANAAQVLAAFEGHNLRLVLQGHLHVNEILRRGDTTFVVGGAICGDAWRGPMRGTREGFGVATLRHDRIDWRYVEYGWSARRPSG